MIFERYVRVFLGLHVTVDWMDKSCTLTQDSTFVKFNFTGSSNGTLSQWTMDKLGYTVDPYSVVVNGSAFQHSMFRY